MNTKFFAAAAFTVLGASHTFAASSRFYYDYPLSGEAGPVHYTVGEGNHPAGGWLQLGKLASTGTYGLEYSFGIYGGSVNVTRVALDLASGNLHIKSDYKADPSDIGPTATGSDHARYVAYVVALRDNFKNVAAGNPAHPELAPAATYLEQVVQNNLNGGLASNGIPYCYPDYSWGTVYSCGDFQCAKSDYEYKNACVIGPK